ncbi:hypothetical protein AD16_4307 [Escherichia coli 3-267-03_S4_C2]|nr:hypothetical protein AD16_4307 [Escherichia coli 3-267-03_S4_C2]KEK74882.1 hypothetical protein AC07_4214 [Escherichia coli 3-475-03_S3_C1]
MVDKSLTLSIQSIFSYIDPTPHIHHLPLTQNLHFFLHIQQNISINCNVKK